ncbi:MAG: cyclic nucleotide-binding domain-containing protein [Chloroflexi bacterium]|nr:cyclic nucleotide-binding domain-containing protein [Chloroflexota bacterium]MBV9596007.1 cyclic nucleotide-binding domain-containing protein [Chloroflexota bacterium]
MDQPISLDTVVGFLLTTPLFDTLDSAERAEVVRIMDVQRFTDGEVIFHEGEPGDAWYILYEGKAQVHKGDWQIRILEPGAAFGEIAILDGHARSATIRAQGPLTIFRFRRERFEELLDQGSLGAYKLVLALARMLSVHHRELTYRLAELIAHQVAVSDRDNAAPVLAGYQIVE